MHVFVDSYHKDTKCQQVYTYRVDSSMKQLDFVLLLSLKLGFL